jgi:hypothetical protein
MRPPRFARSAFAALLLAIPAAAAAQAQPLRHEKTGLGIPAALADMARTGTEMGEPLVAAYSSADGTASAAIAVGRAARAPTVETMRRESRSHAGGAPQILSEGPFAWPGHPQAITFRGSYAAGDARTQLWQAWDAGQGVLVTVTTRRSGTDAMERAAIAVVMEVFGSGSPR